MPVKPCSCRHAEQDKLHGPGLRVHNPSEKGLRCTVCGAEKIVEQKKPEKKENEKDGTSGKPGKDG